MKVWKKLTNRTISIMLAFVLFLGFVPITYSTAELNADGVPLADVATGAYGTGSANLNEGDPNTEYRFYAEQFYSAAPGKSTVMAGVERNTVIYAYLNEGETVYFGSSVPNSVLTPTRVLNQDANYGGVARTKLATHNLSGAYPGKNFYETGADIVLTLPNGTKVPFDVEQDGVGYIGNHTQEMNGPRLNSADQDDETRYRPLSYTVPKSANGTDNAGVYAFDFHPVTGVNAGTNPSPTFINAAFQQSYAAVAAFDVTVVGDCEDSAGGYKQEVKNGRVWANYLALNNGAVAKSSMELFVLTHDGFEYKVDFNDIMPYGFVFFANNMGFTTTGKTHLSIYHSFYDNDNTLQNIEAEEGIMVHRPNEADTDTEWTYKLFFSPPSVDLPSSIKPIPSGDAVLENVKFEGNTPGVPVADYQQGGKFTFDVYGASAVTIAIDFREKLEEMQKDPEAHDTMQNYKGSGIVQLNCAVTEGANVIYWDGKDTLGFYVPVGLYAVDSTTIKIEYTAKGGEVHFPTIDAEGLQEGVTIERMTNVDGDAGNDRFDLYYNNNPLVYGTVDGTPGVAKADGYFHLNDDGTVRSYKVASSVGGAKFFDTKNPRTISTLVRDVDESGAYTGTYHHEPVDSSSKTTNMIYRAEGGYGGGNQAGIDMWTYYTMTADVFNWESAFAVMPSENTDGRVEGTVFYDENQDGSYRSGDGDQPLRGVTVRLLDQDGVPVTRTEMIPKFAEDGNFLYDEDGKVVYEETERKFQTTSLADGHYIITGVPIAEEGTTYYVQAALLPVQTDVLQYLCTTATNTGIISSIPAGSGPDGNTTTYIVDPDTGNRVYSYVRTEEDAPVFDKTNAQSITLTQTEPNKEVKDIGYVSTVPSEFRRNYQVRKEWEPGTDHLPSVTVELWKWTDGGDAGTGSQGVNFRKGSLVDTVKLSADNGWAHTWRNMDNRYEYYMIEYYTKTKENGDVIHLDDGSERLVLIGGTMPIFANAPDTSKGESLYYEYADGVYSDVLKQYFGDSSKTVPHEDAITELEKQTTIDNNALLYNMTYRLSRSQDEKTYTVYLTNGQTYDEREYYVWLDHERELPDFVTKTTIAGNGTMRRNSESLQANPDGTIKGLTVTSLDNGGDATSAFRYNPGNPSGVLFTATTHGNYSEGVGTRSYKVEYTDPETHKYSTWTLTVHVYDANSLPEPVLYDPSNFDGTTVQTGLYSSTEMEWRWNAVNGTYDYVRSATVDGRLQLLDEDTYRVPLYSNAVEKLMGTCADIVGIAYSPEGVVDDEAAGRLTYWDTNEQINHTVRGDYADVDGADTGMGGNGMAEAYSPSGAARVTLSNERMKNIGRGQDHATYANVTFQPNGLNVEEETFYYKIVVFGEDISYNYLTSYDDIDATRGVVMYASFTMKPITENANIAGATLSIKDQIELNYYVDGLTDETVENYYMRFTTDDGSVDIVQPFVWDRNLTLDRAPEYGKHLNGNETEKDRLYGYTYQNISAFDIPTDITATLYYSSNGVYFARMDSRTYSVQEYAEDMLAHGRVGDGNPKLYAMLVDILNYGATAQQYAGDSRPLSNEKLADAANDNWFVLGSKDGFDHTNYWDMVDGVSRETLEPYAYDLTGNVKVRGVSVVMEDGMSVGLKVEFVLPSKSDPKDFNISIRSYADDNMQYGDLRKDSNNEILLNNEDFTPVSGGLYSVTVKHIPAFFWGNPFELTFDNGVSKSVLKYSVLSYCYDMSDPTAENSSTVLSRLVKAMYNYSITADEWFKSEEGYPDTYDHISKHR